jgi:hypothetical protein
MGKFDDYLFHPSGLGTLMSNKQGKKDTTCLEELGETAKKALQQIWIEETYGRRKEIESKFLDKGNECEEDTITLHSRVDKVFFKKNEETIKNEYFIGTPDAYLGETIYTADEIEDFKTSWDIFTFHEAVFSEKVNSDYEKQLNAYMDMTTARVSYLRYGLVNTPEKMIEDEKRRLAWKMGLIDPHSDELYLRKAEMIEIKSKYDDIPLEKRVHKIKVEYNEELMWSVKQRTKIWKDYLNSLK